MPSAPTPGPGAAPGSGPPAAAVEVLLRRPPAPLPALGAGEWDALLAEASRHGLLSALLERLPAGGPPPAARERLRHLLAAARVGSSRLRAVLDEVLRRLDASGIRVAALKGPLLADRLHRDPAARVSGDLDLLVAAADLDAAAAALGPLGYRAPGGLLERFQRLHHHHLSLHRPGAPPVELHFRAFTGFGTVLPAEELLARAGPHRTAGGAPALVLAPEDEALYLALHAAGHLLERLGWLHDLELLAEARPALDWAVVAGRARAAGAARALAYVVGELRRLGAAVPEAAGARLSPARIRVADRLRRAVLSRENDRLAKGLRIAFHLVLCDRPAAAASLAGREAVWFVRRRAHRRPHARPPRT